MPDSIPPMIQKESSYEPISMPEFASTIPPTLLVKVPDEMKWIMETLSRLTQAVDWLCHNIVEENKHLREMDTRRIETRLVVMALSEEQKQLKERVNRLEECYKAELMEKEEDEKDRPSTTKALAILLRSRWFLLLLGILIILGGFIGASIGMQGFIKLVSSLI
jgi:hypothetical protein